MSEVSKLSSICSTNNQAKLADFDQHVKDFSFGFVKRRKLNFNVPSQRFPPWLLEWAWKIQIVLEISFVFVTVAGTDFFTPALVSHDADYHLIKSSSNNSIAIETFSSVSTNNFHTDSIPLASVHFHNCLHPSQGHGAAKMMSENIPTRENCHVLAFIVTLIDFLDAPKTFFNPFHNLIML